MDAKVAGFGLSPDPGLITLVMLLRFHGVGVDSEQIRHQFAGAPIGVPEMIRCAKDFGLKARSLTTSWARLAKTPLPGIAVLRDGSFLLLGKSGEEFPLAKVLEGGTWWAGRQLANEKRPGGAPPLQIESDGTVF